MTLPSVAHLPLGDFDSTKRLAFLHGLDLDTENRLEWRAGSGMGKDRIHVGVLGQVVANGP